MILYSTTFTTLEIFAIAMVVLVVFLGLIAYEKYDEK